MSRKKIFVYTESEVKIYNKTCSCTQGFLENNFFN